jgi:hypothetical protein
VSPEQKQFIADIRGDGGFAVCVKSIKELDEALRGAGYAGEDMALFASEQPCVSEVRQGFKPEVEMLNAHSGLLRS